MFHVISIFIVLSKYNSIYKNNKKSGIYTVKMKSNHNSYKEFPV